MGDEVKENALPRAQLREGKLYVEGEKEPYIPDPIRSLWLKVHGVKGHKVFEIDDGKSRASSRIFGLAEIEEDRFAIAGSDRPAIQEIPFSLRAVPEAESKYHWRLSIGFIPHDWEIGGGDQWYVECYAPQSSFDDLMGAYLAGHATALRVGCKTNAWISNLDRHNPPSEPVTWYLVPHLERQSDMPDHAIGEICHLSWEIESKVSRSVEKKLTPYEMGRAAAEDMLSRTAAVEKPSAKQKHDKRITWILVGVVVIAAALLFRS